MTFEVKACIQNMETGFDEDFGEYLVKEVQAIKIPSDLENYFNYQAYGRDCRLNFNCVISDDYYAWQ